MVHVDHFKFDDLLSVQEIVLFTIMVVRYTGIICETLVVKLVLVQTNNLEQIIIIFQWGI